MRQPGQLAQYWHLLSLDAPAVAALIRTGFTLEDRKPFLGGLLASELWKIKKA